MPWWKSAVFYQIYPRSFLDSNGDGIGDLPGIQGKLEYLKWLGVDAVWLSPFYPSPMADFGYDVADYVDVDSVFGTLDDFDQLLDEAHRLGLRLIIDFIPNHTSDLHPWFIESRASKNNEKRDWYIWRDPKDDGSPPTNWLSRFDGENAWQLDETTGQYYLHSFLKEQPDLNWRNPAVRTAMLDVMRFWLDRGVDGFRVDVSYRCLKDTEFRDNPPNSTWTREMDPAARLIERYTKNIPEIHEFNRWLRDVIEEYAERVLIGEMYLPFPELIRHYGDNDQFHIPFNFSLIHSSWGASEIAALIDAYEAVLPEDGWPNWVLGNHDKSRVASRVGPEQARNAMLLLLTLRGTPTVYYGDEIGMLDVPIPPEQIQDPWEKYVPGLGLGRDPERTPMRWTDEPQAGFSSGVPWLPVGDRVGEVNVEVQCTDPKSFLSFTRNLLTLRRSEPDLHGGTCTVLHQEAGLLAYRRGARFLVAINFLTGEQEREFEFELNSVRLATTEGCAWIGDNRPVIFLAGHSAAVFEIA